MPLFVSVSGTNKRVIAAWVSVDGVWKKVRNQYVSVGGAFKRAFTAGTPVSPNGGTIRSTEYNGAANTSSVTILPTGTFTATTGDGDKTDTVSGDRWFTDLPDQTYEVLATLVSTSGLGYTSGTFNTWLPLTNQFTWSAGTNPNANATRTVTVSFQFRRAVDQVVVATSGGYNIVAATSIGDRP